MQFVLSVPFAGKEYRFIIVEYEKTIVYQYFILMANNRSVTIRTDIPVYRNSPKKRLPTIELTDGQINSHEFRQAVFDSLWTHLVSINYCGIANK